MRIIDKFVNPGDVCFDVGAVTMALAQKTTFRSKVFALEPGPPIYERLVQNISLNPEYRNVNHCRKLGSGRQAVFITLARGYEP